MSAPRSEADPCLRNSDATSARILARRCAITTINLVDRVVCHILYLLHLHRKAGAPLAKCLSLYILTPLHASALRRHTAVQIYIIASIQHGAVPIRLVLKSLHYAILVHFMSNKASASE
jgi:hypothetical protein